MSKRFRLISTILRGHWHIEPSTADNLLPILARFLNGEPVSFWDDDDTDPDELDKKLLPYAAVIGAGGILQKSTFDQAPKGSVAIIPVKGAIMKEDYCGSPGTSTMKQWVKEADAHPNIIGGILDIDSGGGSVDGTADLSETIFGTSKPWLTFGNGTMASAAYEIGAAAKEVWSSDRSNIVGSIGVMMTLRDNRAMMEKYGIKTHIINADSSPDKNKDYFDALDGKYETIKEGLLNPMHSFFMENIQKYRAGKLNLKKENVLTGKVYVADVAKSNGLIDRIGTMEQAIERVADMAAALPAQDDFSQQTKISTQNTMKKKFHALMVLMGFAAATTAETDAPEITEENIDQVRAKYEATSADLKLAKEEAATLAAQLKAEQDARVAADQKVKDLESKVAGLGEQPGAMGTNPKKEGTDDIGGGKGKWEGIVDPNSEHMKAADAMGV